LTDNDNLGSYVFWFFFSKKNALLSLHALLVSGLQCGASRDGVFLFARLAAGLPVATAFRGAGRGARAGVGGVLRRGTAGVVDFRVFGSLRVWVFRLVRYDKFGFLAAFARVAVGAMGAGWRVGDAAGAGADAEI
jgi:hypothetical protein